jgi:hypothetical protein
MISNKSLFWAPLVSASVALSCYGATLDVDSAVLRADGTYECSLVLKDFSANSPALSVEFAGVDRYIQNGLTPPSSISNPSLSILSEGGKTKVKMRFNSDKPQTQIGLWVDGELFFS